MRRESRWRGTARTLLAVLTLAGWEAAAAGGDLDTAKGFYREGRFSEAIVKLRAALGELTLLRDLELRRVQLADAYLHLGLAHLALLERDEAREAFREMLRIEPDRRLDPETYAPKVIALLAEARATVPAPSPAPVPAGSLPRRGSKKAPLLLAAGGAGAAAVGVVVARGGSTEEPPAFKPTTQSGTARIQWTGATPGPGSAVSLRAGSCPRGLTASCTNAVALSFQVTAEPALASAYLHIQLLEGAVPCLEGYSLDTMGYTALLAGTPVQLTTRPLILTGRCTPPFRTTALTVFLHERLGPAVAVQGFAGGYEFTP